MMPERVKIWRESISPELLEWLDSDFQDHKEVYGLRDEDLKGKHVLDIGAGDRRFAAFLLINNITEHAYSLEPGLGTKKIYMDKEWVKRLTKELPQDLREALDQKTVAATAEQTPFQDNSFDLVVGRSVNFGTEKQLADRIVELLRIGKEVRLFPVVDEHRPFFERAIIKARQKVPFQHQYKTTLEADIRIDEHGNTKHIKEDVLILKKLDG